jgi:hypothetical protein
VTVEIDPDSEPIRGVVSEENIARGVTGWVQLVTCAAGLDRQAGLMTATYQARTTRRKHRSRTVKKGLVKAHEEQCPNPR